MCAAVTVDAASSSSFAGDVTNPFNSDFSVASCVTYILVLVMVTFTFVLMWNLCFLVF